MHKYAYYTVYYVYFMNIMYKIFLFITFENTTKSIDNDFVHVYNIYVNI